VTTAVTTSRFVPLLPLPPQKRIGVDWSPKLAGKAVKVEKPRDMAVSSSPTISGGTEAQCECENLKPQGQSPLSDDFPPIFSYLNPPSNYNYPIVPIMDTCGQYAPIPMDLVFGHLGRIRKIGEGVYGEVYVGTYLGSADQPSVYKIVAVEGDKLVNGEKQKRFEEIEPEIVVSQQLNSLLDANGFNFTVGFAELFRARVTQGAYPTTCLNSWKLWHKENRSENECPEFELDQLYVIFEYKFGGRDVESYKFRNAQQAFALLIQVVHTLAVGECGVGFEHRDLHWGNILVTPTKDLTTKYRMNGFECEVKTEGILSTIIDFTISRVTGKDGEPIFTDMAHDEEQFLGTEDYQFEIYRFMKQWNENEWSAFHPKTNIYWVHYLVDKLMSKGRYAETISPAHLIYMGKMERFKDLILKFQSCYDFALNYPHEKK